MDIRVLNYKTNTQEKTKKYSNIDIKSIVKGCLADVFGLTIIEENYLLEENTNNTIEILAIDEANQLVIIEFREGKFSRTIKQGLMQIDYIREHISQIKYLVVDKLGSEVSKNVVYSPRLLILTTDFGDYDYNAIKQLPYQIEAVVYNVFSKTIVFAKEYQSHQKNYYQSTISKENELYKQLSDYVLSLGNDVTEFINKNVVSYRRIKNFLFVVAKEELIVYLFKKQYVIKTALDLKKLEAKIEEAYDE